MLKSIHICLSVTAMIAVVFLGTAHAQSGDSASHSQIQKQRQSPLVKTRADNHRSRIKQGVKSGELTQGETRRLVRQQSAYPAESASVYSKRWETLKSRESLSSTPANSCITAHLQGETQSSEASINRDLFTAWITGSRQRGLGTVNAGMLSRLRGLGAGEPRRRCHPVG